MANSTHFSSFKLTLTMSRDDIDSLILASVLILTSGDDPHASDVQVSRPIVYKHVRMHAIASDKLTPSACSVSN